MVQRVYVEKKPGLSPESSNMRSDCREFLGLSEVREVRIWNRYDVEGIDTALFERAKTTVFSEPPVDTVTDDPDTSGACAVFAVEPLPGQFDQRADSAAQCIQMLRPGERPTIRTAKVYAIYGNLQSEELAKLKTYVINPVESREAALEKPETLTMEYELPDSVETVEDFCKLDRNELSELLNRLGLAMDLDDLAFLQTYFRSENRDPTITEIRVVDTYWSDHCRHTTFSTHLDRIDIADETVKAAYARYRNARKEVYGAEKSAERPQTLMDIATLGAKVLKKRGLLPELDESEEINACSIHVPAVVNGQEQDWLLMFKNETHNHPTEIEPFGGAATCIGGCIRDPLSGRAYVHQAMRVTGAGDPRRSLAETMPGKLPQRKLCQTAAAGYSSYGNQIGLATGQVAELYHPGYTAKRLECGAVVAAVPADQVRRERPQAGDVILLLGGRTGRDGIGGATGSSKSHDLKSLSTMASEVQKGNAPEERKLQRLFRDEAVTRMIKRCNDFGAGGVSVAIGELADGLAINLDAVRKKYDGLDGTELAISESQERMAVVISAEDETAFIEAAEKENLEAYRVAVVTEEPRLVMHWKGQIIADLARSFLNSNGAVKHADVSVGAGVSATVRNGTDLRSMASSLACAGQRGLVERFDSTIGAGSLLMPYGGKKQATPAQAMAALLPLLPGQYSEQGSVMAWGCDPDQLSADPYAGAHSAVYTSVAKVVAAGGDYKKVYLTLQEFFEKLRHEPQRWGKPFAALLGAFDAQMELNAAAIGGKDSMSGSFLDKDVPPTLISFAVAPILASDVVSPEFKAAGHPVCLFRGTAEDWETLHALMQNKKVVSAWAVEHGLAEAVMNMSFGNEIGFASDADDRNWYTPMPGAIVAELTDCTDNFCRIGYTTSDETITIHGDAVLISELRRLNDSVLSSVYPLEDGSDKKTPPAFSYEKKERRIPQFKAITPKVLIPVFPGTNCEYDTARALTEAGADAEIFVVRNQNAIQVAQSVEQFAERIADSQMIVIPGGFSGGDEPDGSAKFITAFFRNPAVKEQVAALLEQRDGLMLGICNGFQALVKLGLVPFGRIMEPDATYPTLCYNTIGRHQSRIVRTRVCSNQSPWLSGTSVGEVYAVPISHGEGRFLASPEWIRELAAKGQIVTQYVNLQNEPSMETEFNPNGSVCAIEGICSPDGRVLGKMGHSERVGTNLYRNVPDRYDMKLFESAVKYFQTGKN